MPYIRQGNTIRKADTGKVVGRSRNPQKYLHTLLAIEHGWKPKKTARSHMKAFDKLIRRG